MASPEVLDYIQKCIALGQTSQQVKQALSENGWQPADIEAAFAHLYPQSPTVPSAPAPQQMHPQPTYQPSPSGDFQARYPLSPKKFWKKIIDKLGISFFLALPFAFGVAMIPFALNSNTNDISVGTVVGSAIVGLLIFWAVFLSLYAWYIRVYIRTYYYDAAENFLTIRKGVFTRTEIHVQYQKIQDVYVDQDIVDRVMGLYDVHIASATVSSGMEAHIDGVEKDVAEGIKDYLLQRILSHSNPQNAPASNTPTMPSQNPAVSLSTTEHISSIEFPIRGAWLLKSVIVGVFSSIFIVGVVYLQLFSEDKSGGAFFPYAILITFILIVFKALYSVIWRNNYYFEFTKDFILIRERVISTSEKHVPYSTIQDVIKTQNLFDRIVGLSNVTIQNATQGLNANISIPGLSPADAERLNDIIRGILMTKNTGTVHGL